MKDPHTIGDAIPLWLPVTHVAPTGVLVEGLFLKNGDKVEKDLKTQVITITERDDGRAL